MQITVSKDHCTPGKSSIVLATATLALWNVSA